MVLVKASFQLIVVGGFPLFSIVGRIDRLNDTGTKTDPWGSPYSSITIRTREASPVTSPLRGKAFRNASAARLAQARP
ncbi:hypothetical protein J6590_068713 [Homalodisca vitripennis]|nr:hypothetical protein J6590_068713 [Homalodisca vitripennis]